MGNRHGGILVEEQLHQRPADQVGAADDDGVHGDSAGNPPASRPALFGCSPSTSLAGSMALMMVSVCSDFGNGNCTRIPCTAGSRLSFAISASKSLCPTSAGNTCS